MIFHLWVKLRRWIWSAMVRTPPMGRRGACLRCGRCCAMGFRCPALRGMVGESTWCALPRRRRPRQCRDFPHSPADLREARCHGYSFGVWL